MDDTQTVFLVLWLFSEAWYYQPKNFFPLQHFCFSFFTKNSLKIFTILAGLVIISGGFYPSFLLIMAVGTMFLTVLSCSYVFQINIPNPFQLPSLDSFNLFVSCFIIWQSLLAASSSNAFLFIMISLFHLKASPAEIRRPSRPLVRASSLGTEVYTGIVAWSSLVALMDESITPNFGSKISLLFNFIHLSL